MEIKTKTKSCDKESEEEDGSTCELEAKIAPLTSEPQNGIQKQTFQKRANFSFDLFLECGTPTRQPREHFLLAFDLV